MKRISKKGNRFAAAMMAGMMAVSVMSMNVFAAETGTGGMTTTSFTKTLDMSEADGASVPDVTFTYEMAPGSGVAATETTPEILPGVGNPTVGNADYDVTDTAVDLTKNVTVDFSAVTFTKPGIYRYVITEDASANADITNDVNAVRYLDVYVVNGASGTGYDISAYELTTPGMEESKGSGYTNVYTTYQLTLDKVVDGAMGDKGREFDFTIEFTGPANASFTYGDEKITLDADGKASVSGIKLADATPEKVITGIPSTVTYVITENIEVTEGYTTSNTVNGAATEGGTTTGEQTMGKENDKVVFTNNRDAATPTGVIMNIAPYILMVAVAAVFALVFLRKRNHFEG